MGNLQEQMRGSWNRTKLYVSPQRTALDAALTRLIKLNKLSLAAVVDNYLVKTPDREMGALPPEVREAVNESFPPLTGEALAANGFEWYDGPGATGDIMCRAYYQKFYPNYTVEIHFYVFLAGLPQPNLKIERHNGFQEKIEMVGIPVEWTVERLENYCQSLMDAMDSGPEKGRPDSFREMLRERIENVQNGTAKTLSMEEVMAEIQGELDLNDE